MQFVNSIARLVVSIYIAALLAGPSPWGWASFDAHGHSQVAGWTAFAIVLIVPWAIAGFTAGPRLAVQTLAAGFVFWQLHFFRGGLAFLILMMMVIPIAFVWLGAWASRRWGVDAALCGWRHWWAPGIVALMMVVYTTTLGPSVAQRALKAKFKPSASEKITSYPAGAYVGVDGITPCTGGFPDTYYTDPSGRSFLYKTNLD